MRLLRFIGTETSRAAALAILSLPAAVAAARAQEVPGLSFYGLPGHVEMPSALALPDGTLAFSLNRSGIGVQRASMVFQITPRLTGSFRYSYLDGYFASGVSLYDRSFDLRYQLVTEDPDGWRPAVAVGLQDFGGTSIFGAEYLVATKQFGPGITATAGIGWGRFGSYNGFTNPLGVISEKFETRPGFTGLEDTGKVDFDRFFRGDAAVFLGVDWQATDRLRLSVEYSSDAMTQEVQRMGFDHRTPINLGLGYRFDNGAVLDLALLNGSTAIIGYSVTLNPARPRHPSGIEAGPPPVAPGSAEAAASWGPLPDEARKTRLAGAMAQQGLVLEGISVNGDTATVAISNTRWPSSAQAYGRAARVLSAQLPAEVQTFRIIGHAKGMPVTRVTLNRRDLEQLEYAADGSELALARAEVVDAAGVPDPRLNKAKPMDVRLRPYVVPSLFDPDNPVRLDFGAELRAEWSPMNGVYLSGAVRKKVIGNRDESTRVSDSVLPHVRSDAAQYAKGADLWVPYLTAEYFARPGTDLYSRVSFGLLEQMFGGVSGEVLWAPPDRRLALGAELNYVKQRDFDGGFGFQDYDILTGHLSAYYRLNGGYLAQVDVGRYLAGDWGSTFTLTRRFGNGFEVGAFFTLTDVSFDDFGEGSFDKGITLRVPLSWVTGKATKETGGTTIRPIQRDGGARLSVRNRLYELTESDRQDELGDRWGRFWR